MSLKPVRCCWLLFSFWCMALLVSAAEPVVLRFDELAADDVIGNPLGLHTADTYRRKGLFLTTGVCRGEPAIGKTLAVRQTYNGFEVLGGQRQPAISPPNFIIPVRGGPEGCLLLEFNQPVIRVRVTTDRCTPEKRDTVRLYALEPLGKQQFTIIAVKAAFDDAVTEPDNLLEVRSQTPFRFALFECTTEQEGFDDLEFEPAEVPPEKTGK